MKANQTYKEQIEALVLEWNKISSACQWARWAEKVRVTKFGTYGTISISEVIENTQVKFPSSWVKDSFLNEVKDALKKVQY